MHNINFNALPLYSKAIMQLLQKFKKFPSILKKSFLSPEIFCRILTSFFPKMFLISSLPAFKIELMHVIYRGERQKNQISIFLETILSISSTNYTNHHALWPRPTSNYYNIEALDKKLFTAISSQR